MTNFLFKILNTKKFNFIRKQQVKSLANDDLNLSSLMNPLLHITKHNPLISDKIGINIFQIKYFLLSIKSSLHLQGRLIHTNDTPIILYQQFKSAMLFFSNLKKHDTSLIK